MNKQSSTEEERNELIRVLTGVLEEPYGCPMCDSGKLRNPEKQHWPECFFYQAKNLIANVGWQASLNQAERFKKPIDQQVVKAAIVFNDGKMDKKELMNMVALADFIIDRLYENGDIMIPSSKEK